MLLPKLASKEDQLALARQKIQEANQAQAIRVANGSQEPGETTEEQDLADAVIERQLERIAMGEEDSHVNGKIPPECEERGYHEFVQDMLDKSGPMKCRECGMVLKEPTTKVNIPGRPARRGRPPKKSQAESEAQALVALSPPFLPYADGAYFNLPQDLTYDQWAQCMAYARLVDKNLHWYIGDLLLFADVHGKDWEEKGIQLADTLGFSPGTLANIRSVTRRFWANPYAPGAEASMKRHAALTYQHHVEVAWLEPALAEELLCRAEVGDGRHPWTTEQLRVEVRARKAKKVEPAAEESAPRKRTPNQEEKNAVEEENSFASPSEATAPDANAAPSSPPDYDFAQHASIAMDVVRSLVFARIEIERESADNLEPGYRAILDVLDKASELRDSYETLGCGED